jgi:hypothetical protein
MTSSSEIRTREVRDETRRKAFRAGFLRSSTSGPRGCQARRQRADEDTGPRRDTSGDTEYPVGTRHRPRAVEQYADDLQGLWWARTVSNRRPLVCKSEPERPRHFARCRSVLECPARRLVRVHSVRGLSACVCPSWHTLGTTGGLIVRRSVAFAGRTWLNDARTARFNYLLSPTADPHARRGRRRAGSRWRCSLSAADLRMAASAMTADSWPSESCTW